MAQVSDKNTDNIKLAIAAIIVSVFSLSIGDAIIKGLSVSFTLWQLFIFRSLFAIITMLGIIKFRSPNLSLMPKRYGWTALRSLMLTCMWLIYYLALKNVEISVAGAAFYTLPIFIALFAALFNNEKVGRAGWLAVSLGFVGILFILKPQADDFNFYALLPLASAILYALSMIMTRTKCKQESPEILALHLHITFAVVGVFAMGVLTFYVPSAEKISVNPFLLGPFGPMGMIEWGVVFVLAMAAIMGSYFGALAYQSGPSSTLATFDFSYLAFVTLWGIFFFNETLDATTLAGMTLITLAGILAIRRKAY